MYGTTSVVKVFRAVYWRPSTTYDILGVLQRLVTQIGEHETGVDRIADGYGAKAVRWEQAVWLRYYRNVHRRVR